MTTDDLEPSPAQMGDTMTVTAGEWTPLDDHGTQIYVYGEQPVDMAVQYAPGTPEVSFHDLDGTTAVYVGAQRVVRIPNSNEQAINAVVDVLEAMGMQPKRFARSAPSDVHEHDGYCLKAGGACSPEAQEVRP